MNLARFSGRQLLLAVDDCAVDREVRVFSGPVR